MQRESDVCESVCEADVLVHGRRRCRACYLCVCVCHLWRHQAQPSTESKGRINSLSPPNTQTLLRRAHITSAPEAARALSLTHSLSLPCLPLPLPLYSRVSSDQIKGGVESNAAKVVGQFSGMRFYPQIAFSEIDLQLFAVFDPTPPFT